MVLAPDGSGQLILGSFGLKGGLYKVRLCGAKPSPFACLLAKEGKQGW
jgi:hypothetical protein